jgi:hypothetical protein
VNRETWYCFVEQDEVETVRKEDGRNPSLSESSAGPRKNCDIRSLPRMMVAPYRDKLLRSIKLFVDGRTWRQHLVPLSVYLRTWMNVVGNGVVVNELQDLMLLNAQ